MKCPECGREVPEGNVYCEGCGWEFHMVPAFEPEIENQIDKALTRLGDKIEQGGRDNRDGSGKADGARNGKSRRETKNGRDAKNGKGTKAGTEKRTQERTRKGLVSGKRVTAVILVLCVIALVTVFATAHKTTNELTRLAIRNADAENYGEALRFLEQARKKEPGDAALLFLQADIERRAGEDAAALETLSEAVNSAAFTDGETERAYRESAAILYDASDGAALEALLLKCPYEAVREVYEKDRPPAPEATPADGTFAFEDGTAVTLRAQEGCAVYYTLDGTEPDAGSDRYDAPLKLETPGEHRLKAVAYSPKGLRGAVLETAYTVEEKKVPGPRIFEDSGTYREATRIVVHADKGLEIRYTVGEEETPDKNSTLYREPIPMPEGKSVYRFVTVDETGRLSEVEERIYDLVIEHPVSADEAVAGVKAALISAGYMEDASGRSRGENGVLSYHVEGTVEIGSDGMFYAIREYLTDASGLTAETGRLYAVQTKTGKAMRLGFDSFGQMILMQI